MTDRSLEEARAETCSHCGEMFTPKQKNSRFCSRACYDKHRYASGYRKRKRHKLTCSLCSKQFMSSRRDQTYCSKKCSSQVAAKVRGEQLSQGVNLSKPKAYIHKKRFSHVHFRQCLWCGDKFTSQTRAMYCSVVCSTEAGRARSRVRSRTLYQTQMVLSEERYVKRKFMCAECGKEVVTSYKNQRHRFCSDECSEKNEKRKYNSRRRASTVGANADNIDPMLVFKRDNWTCQLCGTKTLKSKRGTTHNRAPELDHILPLSIGGAHTYKNTQCTCRSCNGNKGAKPIGQLRLC